MIPRPKSATLLWHSSFPFLFFFSFGYITLAFFRNLLFGGRRAPPLVPSPLVCLSQTMVCLRLLLLTHRFFFLINNYTNLIRQQPKKIKTHKILQNRRTILIPSSNSIIEVLHNICHHLICSSNICPSINISNFDHNK